MSKRRLWLLGVTGLAVVALLGAASAARADVIDPNVGFCATPGSKTACTTGTGLGGETIPVNSTGFAMLSNGSQNSKTPWFLILAIPEQTDGAVTSSPTITSTGGIFTQKGSTTDAGDFKQTTKGDLYSFVSSITGGLAGDGSMNAKNLFCDGAAIPCTSSNEISASGFLPYDFEVFVYEFIPGFKGNTIYDFTSSGIPAGTFLAAVGVGGKKDNIQFSTPFTTAGLVKGPPPVPEPATLLMLGSGLLALGGIFRRRLRSGS